MKLSHHIGVTSDFLLGIAKTNLADISTLTGSQVSRDYQLVPEYKKQINTPDRFASRERLFPHYLLPF